jgi:hypothetical protein
VEGEKEKVVNELEEGIEKGEEKGENDESNDGEIEKSE